MRIFFSEPLSSLDASEVEIRDLKSKQLFSLESVKLSSTGLFADVILYGSHDADGTTFLQPNTPYVATIDHDGMTDSLEFELPANAADEVVVGVDEEENVIYTQYSERTQAIHDGWTNVAAINLPAAPPVNDYYLGVSYDGNIGELLGRTVNFGYNGDEVITDLTVQDEVVVIDSMEYVDADKSHTVNKKDYFKTNDGAKYYFEENNSATKNKTHYIKANNKDNAFATAWAGGANGTFNVLGLVDGHTYNYVRLVLNPTGTIATVVYNDGLTDFLKVASVDDNVVIADKNTSMNFTGYTIFDSEALISTDDLEEGDVVYYSVPDKFAYVYNEEVSGELDNVIHEKLDLDGTTYTWTGAKYFDDGSSTYKTLEAGTDAKSVASQKYLNSLDPDDVTITLNMGGTIAYVDGEVVGASETTTTTYLLTAAAKQDTVGFDEMIQIKANDGSADATIEFNPTGLKSLNGESGKTDSVDATNHEFTFKPTDGAPATITIDPTDWDYTELIDVTTDNDTGAVVGVKELAELNAGKTDGTPITITATSSSNKINSTTTWVADANNKSYAVNASTKVWVVVDKTATTAKSVKMVPFSDFAMATTAVGTATNFVADVYPDKANAKNIVIHQVGADDDVWETGEKATVTGVVVGTTEIAKGDGSDTVVLKDITVQDATGAKLVLDADGNVTKGAISAGDLVTLTYTKSDTKIVDKAKIAWTTNAQSKTVDYSSNSILLDNGTTLAPYTNCLTLKKSTVGSTTTWDPITVGEITSSANGWTVDYHAVSTAGTNSTVDFVVVTATGNDKVQTLNVSVGANGAISGNTAQKNGTLYYAVVAPATATAVDSFTTQTTFADATTALVGAGTLLTTPPTITSAHNTNVLVVVEIKDGKVVSAGRSAAIATAYSASMPVINVTDPTAVTITATGSTGIKYKVAAANSTPAASAITTAYTTAFDATTGLTTGTYKVYAIATDNYGASDIVASATITIP